MCLPSPAKHDIISLVCAVEAWANKEKIARYTSRFAPHLHRSRFHHCSLGRLQQVSLSEPGARNVSVEPSSHR